MSKYQKLWQYVQNCTDTTLLLTFSQIEEIAGFPIDHSFLTYKKELLQFSWQVEKISQKQKTVLFARL